ncbi:MAG: ABC transporter ATP-binding protein/permease, partial [Maledivibacter sp.]|nr:ABC transporter ATP-binding protein/permease [Maledivibacter sp.]
LLKLAGDKKRLLIGSIVLSVIGSIFGTLIYFMLFKVIIVLTDTKIQYKDLWAISKYIVIFVGINIVAGILSGMLSHIAAFNILYEIRIRVCNHLPKLNMGFFNKNTIGEIKKTINEDVEKLELFLAHQLPDLVTAMISPIFILAIMIHFNLVLGIIMIIPVALALVAQKQAFKHYSKNMVTYNHFQRKMNTAIIQYVKGMKVFKAFNISSVSFKQFRDSVEEHSDFWIKTTKESVPFYVNYMLLLESGTLFSVPIGGYMLIRGHIKFPAFLLIMILSIFLFESFKSLLSLSQELNILLAGVGNIRKIIETPIQQDGNVELEENISHDITFNNVSFSYESTEILHKVSFRVGNNSTIALVGASGSGKTTITQLVGRFWDIQKGIISIGGINIKELSTECLMKNIAYVFQEVYLIKDTLYENIRMGMDKTEEEIIEASKKAQIHDFISSLPNGYYTKIAHSGVKLSMGQAQRISIARCILKESRIVVLDEATAYADLENERKIQLALDQLLKNKTAIIIAHRLNTIQHADQIIVLEEGNIVEQGTHKILMSKNGIYTKMWKSYRKEDGFC